MPSITNLLNRALRSPERLPNRPSTAAATAAATAHGTLPIHRSSPPRGGCTPRRQPDGPHVTVRRYASEAELQLQWDQWDTLPGADRCLTIVLALGSFLQANLRDLIRRRWPAARLVLVPRMGHWPGLDSFGDLALAPGALGWNSIELCRNLGDALENTLVAFGRNDHLLVLLPTNAVAHP